jgi:hypothetical protein
VSQGRRSDKAVPGGVFLAAILCASLNAAAQGPASAEPSAERGPAAAQYVESFIERVRAEVRAKNESSRAGNSPSSGGKVPDNSLTSRLAAALPEAQQAALAVLAAHAEPVAQDLRKAAADLDQAIREVAAAWTPVRTALWQHGVLLERLRGEQPGRLMTLLSLDDHWFWASLLLAWAALAGVLVHAHRHALRRRWGVPRIGPGNRRWFWAGFGLLVILAGGLGTLDRLADARRQSRNHTSQLPDDLLEDLPRVESDLQGVGPTIEAGSKVRAVLNVPARDSMDTRQWLALTSAGFRDLALEVVERLETLDQLSSAIQNDLQRLARLQEELRDTSAVAGRLNRWRKGIRGFIGAASLVAVAAGAWLALREAKRRRVAAESTCPLCLGPIRPDAAPRNGRATANTNLVRCGNILDRDKGVRCDFVLRDAYRAMPRLCFPTLGVPSAGKTHWLAMTYWQLNRGGYPRWMRVERVRPVETASGEDFDRIVEQILISRLGTTGTQGTRIPRPLVFRFSDCDPWGPSSVLVNVFDYSGEVTATMGLDDYRRRRAMEADGYLFFLDPTLPAEPQAKALADFREDLRLLKGLSGRRAIQVPLAACVSKIDLLVRQSYALPNGGDAVAGFYEELARIDPTGEAVTLDVIRARSRLTAELSATLWPGWQVERTLEDAFGGHWMFFPLTPVGLDGRGETDLSLRTIAPFGLVEPLAWLLHMNGYPVLP